jgi:hypothetical protein
LIANARFLRVFSKEDLLSKNNRSDKNEIKRSKLKNCNFRSKKFLSAKFEVAKSFPSRKTNEKVQICKMHRPLINVFWTYFGIENISLLKISDVLKVITKSLNFQFFENK